MPREFHFYSLKIRKRTSYVFRSTGSYNIIDNLDIVSALLEVPELQLGRCSNVGWTALHYTSSSPNTNRVSIMKLL